MNTSQKIAQILLSIKAVEFNPKKPYRYASGILSPIYTDCRTLMSYPKERTLVRDYYIQAIKDSGLKFDLLAGTATAGIPHAAWVSQELNLPMVYVRGKAKEHGKAKQIEGIVEKGQKVAVIEDLISTGGSSVETVRALREAGTKADHVFSIFTYNLTESKEKFKENSIQLISLTNFETMVSQAVKTGYLKAKDKELVLAWSKNPTTWQV